MLACVHICVRCVHSRSSPLSPPHLQLASARGLLAVIPRPCSLSGRACVRAMQASISELAVLPPQRMRECVVPFLFVDAKTRAWGQKCRKTKRRTRRVLRFGSVVKMYDYKERRGRAWFAHADKRNPQPSRRTPLPQTRVACTVVRWIRSSRNVKRGRLFAASRSTKGGATTQRKRGRVWFGARVTRARDALVEGCDTFPLRLVVLI